MNNNCLNCNHSKQITFFDKNKNKVILYNDVVLCNSQLKINDLLCKSNLQLLHPTVTPIKNKCKFFEMDLNKFVAII